MNIPNNPNNIDVIKALKNLNAEKLNSSLGSSYVNKVLVTDNEGNISFEDIQTFKNDSKDVKYQYMTNLGEGIHYITSGLSGDITDTNKIYINIDDNHLSINEGAYMLLSSTIQDLKSSYTETLSVIQSTYINSSLYINNSESKYLILDILDIGKMICRLISNGDNYTIEFATLISYIEGYAVSYGTDPNNLIILYDNKSLNGAQKLFFYNAGNDDGIYYRVAGRDTIEDIYITIQGVQYNLIKFIYEFLGQDFETIESNHTTIWSYLSQYIIDNYYNETNTMDINVDMCGIASINFNFENDGSGNYKIKEVIGINHIFGECWVLDSTEIGKLYTSVNDIRLDTTSVSSLSTSNDEAVINSVVRLHKISKTGSYTDLLNTPTNLSQFNNDMNYIVSSTLDDYATTDSINTLMANMNTNTIIPMQTNISNLQTNMNNAETNISNLQTNLSNLQSDVANMVIPTKVSELSNDLGYLVANDIANLATTSYVNTKAETLQNKIDAIVIPTKVSAFNNDAGYLVQTDLANYATINLIPTNTNQLANGAGFITSMNVAYTNKSNTFEAAQTINGNLTVTGNITQAGSSYETHAEKIYTTKDYIILREGATGGLAAGDYAGIEATLYDGTNNGRLAFDSNGIARVGDVGDEEPIATRAETLTDGATVVWDNSALRLISGYTIVTCTTAQYEASSKDGNTIYILTD